LREVLDALESPQGLPPLLVELGNLGGQHVDEVAMVAESIAGIRAILDGRAAAEARGR